VILPPLARIRLRLTAPLGTPLLSGTLFGHVCWALREAEGAASLQAWLAAQDDAPTILSDGFPEGLLPRPLLAPPPPRIPQGQADADAAKARGRRPWIRATDLAALRLRLDPVFLADKLVDAPWHDDDAVAAVRVAHGPVDSASGRGRDAARFVVEEDWSFGRAPLRDVYVRSVEAPTRLAALLSAVGETGYGRSASWGRGRFVVDAIDAVPELDGAEGTRWLSLSHGTIDAPMRDARYRLTTHSGRLGAAASGDGTRPWKHAILLAAPGATFAATGNGPFGTLLAGVHPGAEAVRHDARHVAIRYAEVVHP
jgi:CRISPR-associated protein Csm4